jgi:hypothetical protein
MIYETDIKVRNFFRFYGEDMKNVADNLQGRPTTRDLNDATSLLLKVHDLLKEVVQ